MNNYIKEKLKNYTPIELMPPFGFIYMTTNEITGKKYIGKRQYSWRGWGSYLGSGEAFTKSVEKYGRENFSRKILDFAYSEKELNQLEKYYIKKYNAVKSKEFYNIAEGGEGGKREGAGRKPSGKKKRNYYVTDQEHAEIKKLIELIRADLNKEGEKK